jgi:hypothetical protein
MTLLVRDEADIVEANVEHHLGAGVDLVIATDNNSVDDTAARLRRFEARGVLSLWFEPADDYAQHRWVTAMARAAATDLGADWVINNDADEFWWPADGDLATTLATVPDDIGRVVAHRYDFVARPEDGRPWWERMTIRRTQPRHPDGGPLPPKVCHRADPDVVVRQGNHEVDGPVLGDHPPLDDGRLEILHFPVRSYAQMERKVLVGGAAYERNTELPPEVGHRWRQLYRVHQAGGFPQAYAAMVPSDAEIDRGLADGTYVEDTRLRDQLRRRSLR